MARISNIYTSFIKPWVLSMLLHDQNWIEWMSAFGKKTLHRYLHVFWRRSTRYLADTLLAARPPSTTALLRLLVRWPRPETGLLALWLWKTCCSWLLCLLIEVASRRHGCRRVCGRPSSAPVAGSRGRRLLCGVLLVVGAAASCHHGPWTAVVLVAWLLALHLAPRWICLSITTFWVSASGNWASGNDASLTCWALVCV